MLVRTVEVQQPCCTIEEGGVKWLTKDDYQRWLVDKGLSDNDAAKVW